MEIVCNRNIILSMDKLSQLLKTKQMTFIEVDIFNTYLIKTQAVIKYSSILKDTKENTIFLFETLVIR